MTAIEDNDERELMKCLTRLCRLGPILPSSGGANAVGKTLQEQLGIKHTTNRKNSLFNYTITATTAKPSSGGRTNLFASVPDWKNSVYKNTTELAQTFGREDLSRGYEKSLFCTVTSLAPNGFGLFLKVNPAASTLEEWYVNDKDNRPVVAWDVAKLNDKLNSQSKTAIVTALPVEVGGERAFHYRYVDLLGSTQPKSFLELLEDGMITIDHCISLKVGSSSAREQGPLFKVRADARSELYSDVKRIDLMDYDA